MAQRAAPPRSRHGWSILIQSARVSPRVRGSTGIGGPREVAVAHPYLVSVDPTLVEARAGERRAAGRCRVAGALAGVEPFRAHDAMARTVAGALEITGARDAAHL